MVTDLRLGAPRQTFRQHASMWVDMVPHVDQLRELASEVTTVLEWGVRGGVSTWALLEGLPADGRLTSVDVERHPLPVAVENDPRWTFVLGDDLAIGHEPAELVFIDTTHEYAQTLAELRLAERLGARIIALHDWALVPVREAVLDWLPAGWTLDVHPSEWGLAVVRR